MSEAITPKEATSNATAGATPVPKPKQGPRGQVTIFGKWCKGCGLCVNFCPTGVLAFNEWDDFPIVVAPEKCTACHWCDTHCPDLAIIVKPFES
jgi:2-oxoglutarate ferredoxin oxidoreductase subunit delta